MAKVAGWGSEAEMQMSFTRWLKGADGEAWMSARGGVGAFELKHVSCKGKPSCTPLRCGSRLRISEHEEGQAEMLLRAIGKGGGGVGRPLVHKISDMSAGVKPFDCFYMKASTDVVVSMFVVGWSCKKAVTSTSDDCGDVYGVRVERWCKMTCEKKSVSVDDCRRFGFRLRLGK